MFDILDIPDLFSSCWTNSTICQSCSHNCKCFCVHLNIDLDELNRFINTNLPQDCKIESTNLKFHEDLCWRGSNFALSYNNPWKNFYLQLLSQRERQNCWIQETHIHQFCWGCWIRNHICQPDPILAESDWEWEHKTWWLHHSTSGCEVCLEITVIRWNYFQQTYFSYQDIFHWSFSHSVRSLSKILF